MISLNDALPVSRVQATETTSASILQVHDAFNGHEMDQRRQNHVTAMPRYALSFASTELCETRVSRTMVRPPLILRLRRS